MAAKAPAAKSSESPGRNGVTTSPVSQKTISDQDAVGPPAVVGDDLAQVGVEMEDEVDELAEEFHAGRQCSTAKRWTCGRRGRGSTIRAVPDSHSVPGPVSGEITALLSAARGGDRASEERLLALVYDDLKRRNAAIAATEKASVESR